MRILMYEDTWEEHLFSQMGVRSDEEAIEAIDKILKHAKYTYLVRLRDKLANRIADRELLGDRDE